MESAWMIREVTLYLLSKIDIPHPMNQKVALEWINLEIN